MTAEEKKLIQEKMRLLHTDNFNAYALKMVSNGYIVIADYAEIKNHAAELQRITVNIVQIMKHSDAMGAAFAVGVEKIKLKLTDIWRIERQLFK
ncbi:MAG: plasmid mobilization relaxosome protein MobC [Treponema sp.]|nr:plasmid mobilization relaxosome protein MobC [Treponema sp.]